MHSNYILLLLLLATPSVFAPPPTPEHAPPQPPPPPASTSPNKSSKYNSITGIRWNVNHDRPYNKDLNGGNLDNKVLVIKVSDKIPVPHHDEAARKAHEFYNQIVVPDPIHPLQSARDAFVAPHPLNERALLVRFSDRNRVGDVKKTRTSVTGWVTLDPTKPADFLGRYDSESSREVGTKHTDTGHYLLRKPGDDHSKLIKQLPPRPGDGNAAESSSSAEKRQQDFGSERGPKRLRAGGSRDVTTSSTTSSRNPPRQLTVANPSGRRGQGQGHGQLEEHEQEQPEQSGRSPNYYDGGTWSR